MSNNPSSHPKFLLQLPLLLLGIGVIGHLLPFLQLRTEILRDLSPIFKFCLGFGSLSCAYVMLKNGTMINSVFFRLIQGLIALLIIGIMFKLMHWPRAGLILVAAFSGIPITYFIWFLKKEKKELEDILKLLWVISRFTIALFVIMHWINNQYVIIPALLLIITYLIYLKNHTKNQESDRMI